MQSCIPFIGFGSAEGEGAKHGTELDGAMFVEERTNAV
jgi:hypothetical protein